MKIIWISVRVLAERFNIFQLFYFKIKIRFCFGSLTVSSPQLLKVFCWMKEGWAIPLPQWPNVVARNGLETLFDSSSSKVICSQVNLMKPTAIWTGLSKFLILSGHPLYHLRISHPSSQQLVFPSGHPSKYYPGSSLLNFADLTRTGVSVKPLEFPVVIVFKR